MLTGILAGTRDRGFIEVKTVYLDIGIPSSDADTGPPVAASDIGNTRRALGPETGVNVGHGRQPFLSQLVQEGRTVDRRLPLAHVGTVLREGDTATGPIGFHHRCER